MIEYICSILCIIILHIDGVNRRGVGSNLAEEAKCLLDTTVAATFFPDCDCDCDCDTPHPMGFSRTARPNLSRETKISGANGDREKFIFPDGSVDHEQNGQPYPVDPNSAIDSSVWYTRDSCCCSILYLTLK